MTSKNSVTQAVATTSGFVENGTLPGIQYVVVSRNGTLLECCNGATDASTGAPVTPATTFMASSVTKTLTAAAILQLKDRGRLNLDSHLSSLFASHPYGGDLRIDHLLNQSSGVPNPVPLRWLHLADSHSDYDEETALALALKKHAKLRFEPGSKYAYSNLAYWLLGKVIENVSGLSYADYMRSNIFDALGIGSDELDCLIPDPGRHATGHLRRWSVLGYLMPFMMDTRFFAESAPGRRRFKSVYMNGPAYGGLIGTARAFSKFLQDQLQPESVLFGKATRELFYSKQTDSSGRLMETTLGWHRGDLNGTAYYGKPGGGPGFQSNMRLYPSKEIGTVWLANETAASEGPIHALTDQLDRNFI
jgi:D-alanyl-D-alanine carboxypeptidase